MAGQFGLCGKLLTRHAVLQSIKPVHNFAKADRQPAAD